MAELNRCRVAAVLTADTAVQLAVDRLTQIENGQITDCTVLSAEKEDTAYFDAAQGVIDEVLDEQTAEVDTVSGATFSSRGILGAVEDALEQAKAVQHE